ncbi:hypothetical protein FJ950_00150 [Mesorhizobium sp. B2-3-14]|nr:hypothetical protein FJ950_00150 [Mesorhizobium sp. B2-3-14]
MIGRVSSHPPLSCRTSPPQGGRSDAASDFANIQCLLNGEMPELLISPLAGEMSGRTEGGVQAPTCPIKTSECRETPPARDAHACAPVRRSGAVAGTPFRD